MKRPRKFGNTRMPWNPCSLSMRFILVIVVGLFFLGIAFELWFQYRITRPTYRGVEDIEPHLWNLLGPQDVLTEKPVTKRTPQIHIKNFPSIKMQEFWTVREVEEQFYRQVEKKDVKCKKDARLGNWNDGGWNVCMSPPYSFMAPCVVFSFGIGDDWQFDDSVANSYHCQVLAFDPSIDAPVSMSTLVTFYKLGLGDKNEINSKGWRMKTLKQHLKDTRFWGVTIDYLKMDIEYSEWSVLRQAIRDGALKNVKQLAFEMHSPELFRIYKKEGESFPERSKEKDRSDFIVMFDTLISLEAQGFRKFNYRRNPFGDYESVYSRKVRSCCYDLHYINTNFLKENDSVIHTKDSEIFH